jgi:hypothetical protein
VKASSRVGINDVDALTTGLEAGRLPNFSRIIGEAGESELPDFEMDVLQVGLAFLTGLMAVIFGKES